MVDYRSFFEQKVDVAAALYQGGVRSAADVDGHTRLSRNQRSYVEAVKAGEPIIDLGAAREFLDSLEYPIHYLDFESDMRPINRFKEIAPWGHFPFQFSCVTMQENGLADLLEFVHPDPSDPRENFIESLVDEIGPVGSVVVHNASYEKARLRELVALYPHHKKKIDSIIHRIRDTEEGLKRSIVHPDFNGSYSLKAVIPVLVKSPIFLDFVGYNDLEVQDGRQAGVGWDRYVHSTNESERRRLLHNLWAYCRTDTLGMIEIVEVMRSWLEDEA